MNAWIGLIGTIIGAIIAGTLVHFRDSSQRRDSRRVERRALLIDKYEILHKELTDIGSNIGLLAVDLIGVASLDDKIDFEKYKSEIPMNSALMHAQLYAPEITDNVEVLKVKSVEFYRLIWQLSATGSELKNERLAIAAKALDVSGEIETLSKNAKSELSSVARQLIHGA